MHKSSTSQASIYVNQAAYDTAMTVKDLDYYQRSTLCDDMPGFENRPGYHLKNANKLKLAVLPDSASVVRVASQITMPVNLRGCIFEGAPHLPQGYAESVTYWSGDAMNINVSGAVYFQNQQNGYMVDLGPEPVDAPVLKDRLLSEGVVVIITGLASIVAALSPEDYVEVKVPIDAAMLGIEQEEFLSTRAYGAAADESALFSLYLQVADILASPNPDCIAIDALASELYDYGFFY